MDDVGGMDPRVREEALKKYSEERAKRLRPDGISQYQQIAGEFAHYIYDPYVEPGFTRPPINDDVEIAIIGGGFGSLLVGARLQEAGFTDIRFIEKAGDFGGTWYWNRYPGAMCDIESYIYLPLLEEMSYVPKHKYSFAPEILEHARQIGRRFGFYDKACFQTGVTEMRWDEDNARWVISTDRGDRMTARFVTMANGPLNRPKLPGIPGIASFSGRSFHTSRWDYGYTGGDEYGDLTGLHDKRVGVIGTGATAIQCIPHLGRSAKHLYVFQRTPAAVDERNNRETDPSWAKALKPGWQLERMRNFNALVNGLDEPVDLVGDCWTDIFRSLTGVATRQQSERLGRKLSPEERAQFLEAADMAVMDRIRRRIDDVVHDKATAEALKPWYKRWCKRPQFHDGYLETFNLPNVTLVDTNGRGVDRVTQDAVIVGDVEYKVDCLIFATGFEVGTNYTKRADYDVIGRKGRRLSEHWANGFRTLHGLQSHGFPNCFFIGTTQTGVAINYPHSVLEQARHLAYILDEARSRQASTVEVSGEAEAAWVNEIERLARRGQEYYRDCTPGYLTNEGDLNDRRGLLAGAYGGGPIKFFALLDEWRGTGRLPGLELWDGDGQAAALCPEGVLAAPSDDDGHASEGAGQVIGV